MKKWLLAGLLAGLLGLPALAAWALDVRFRPVAEGVYAHIGDTGARTADNEGLNVNIGLVITPAGALLIDSGATFQSARKIHEAVRQVTTQPVKWVFNTGGQDHLQSLKAVLGTQADGTVPTLPTRWLDTFAVIESLDPKRIVPGHGRVTDLATARADTQAYLLALRAHMKTAVDDGVDMSQAVKSFDTRTFARLANAAELMPGNASRTYLELERE